MKDDLVVRLKKEKYELDSLLFQLRTFLCRDDSFKIVGKYQYNMMLMQLDAMRVYSGILHLRLTDLENNNESQT